MEHVLNISWLQLACFSGVLLLPLFINYFYKLSLAKEVLVSVTRMTIQLFLVGLYLHYLFTLNSLIVNILWLLMMILIGCSAIINKAHLPLRALFIPIFCGLSIGLFPIITLLCVFVVQPEPIYSAQYVVPLAGMLLGNSLTSNIVALQNIFGAFEQRKMEYEGGLALGGTPYQAASPFLAEALKKALAPNLASMTTVGLVSLPGMMTGQILGGVTPMLAIKYQLVILIAIFAMSSVSLTITLNLSLKRALSKSGRIKIKFVK